jgi:hypothetical protein
MKAYPAQFGHNPAYSNPNGVLPLPEPPVGAIPTAQWYSPKSKFVWANPVIIDPADENAPPLPPGVLWTYVWTSPAFDLRPDLRSGNAGQLDGVPVWNIAARLRVMIFEQSVSSGPQAPTVNTTGLTVAAAEWANDATNNSMAGYVTDGGSPAGAGLFRLQSRDVTNLFSQSNPPLGNVPGQALLAGFAPAGTTLGFGEGYPVRFWRLQLTFQQLVPLAELPAPDPLPVARPYIMQASYY